VYVSCEDGEEHECACGEAADHWGCCQS
jgi:hypothetical protein